MKYTLEQIHKMTDNELCEAISEAREPNSERGIVIPGQLYDVSKLGNWEKSFVKTIWHPLNWLDPQNWTRLMDEIIRKQIEIEIMMGGKYFTVCKYVIEYGEICGMLWETYSEKLERAICEAWLLLSQENKI